MIHNKYEGLWGFMRLLSPQQQREFVETVMYNEGTRKDPLQVMLLLESRGLHSWGKQKDKKGRKTKNANTGRGSRHG